MKVFLGGREPLVSSTMLTGDNSRKHPAPTPGQMPVLFIQPSGWEHQLWLIRPREATGVVACWAREKVTYRSSRKGAREIAGELPSDLSPRIPLARPTWKSVEREPMDTVRTGQPPRTQRGGEGWTVNLKEQEDPSTPPHTHP